MFPVGQMAQTTPPGAGTSVPPSSERHGPLRDANVRPRSDESAIVSKSGRRRGGPRNQTSDPRAASETGGCVAPSFTLRHASRPIRRRSSVPAVQDVGVATGCCERPDLSVGSCAVPGLPRVAGDVQGSRVHDVGVAVFRVHERNDRLDSPYRKRRQPDAPEVLAGVFGTDERVAVAPAAPIGAEHPEVARPDRGRSLRPEPARHAVRHAASVRGGREGRHGTRDSEGRCESHRPESTPADTVIPLRLRAPPSRPWRRRAPRAEP
jgi:hypothetical protein